MKLNKYNMTKQEIFSKVKKHLLAQGKKSLTGTVCGYRGEDNTQCAIGCLIPDNEYDVEMEGNSARRLLLRYEKLEKLILPSDLNKEDGRIFLTQLQEIHDSYCISTWKHALKCFANEKKLEYI